MEFFQIAILILFGLALSDLIVGVSNYFVPGSPLDNVWAVLETINKYRSLD